MLCKIHENQTSRLSVHRKFSQQMKQVNITLNLLKTMILQLQNEEHRLEINTDTQKFTSTEIQNTNCHTIL